MDYAYSYKTSDGVRHDGEISAKNRDAAYKALNTKGIRPINVVPKPMSPERRRRIVLVWAFIALAAIVCGIVAVRAIRAAFIRIRYQTETRAAFATLSKKAADARAAHASAFASVDFTRFRDYEAIANAKDLASFTEVIVQAKSVIKASRERVKDIFRNIYTIFPAESANERLDAQRLYGEIMNEIDASEERLESDEYALELLDANRDKWGIRNGRIYFSDPLVEKEFRFFRKDTDGSTARWKRDFGHGR